MSGMRLFASGVQVAHVADSVMALAEAFNR